MALIKKSKGRRDDQSPSGYTRLFGISELGSLMSKVHGASITAGTELEKLIIERCKKILDLDAFLGDVDSRTPGIFVATKKQIKQSKLISSRYEPDFLAFDLESRVCYVIEVKDGDQFDTKKAAGEHATLHNFTNDVSQALPFSFQIYICSFNARSKKEVHDGLKHKFSIEEVITGLELCKLLGINYDEIVALRTNDHQNNLEYFVDELVKIPVVNSMLKQATKDESQNSSN